MDVATSNRVVARNSLGRFIRDCEQAAEDTAKQLVEDGARLSAELAPRGSSPDPRTVRLSASLRTEMKSSTSGVWFSIARHALPVEFGGKAHRQTGHASFFWEEQGRDWEPGDNEINHPGNPAQPFLRPAYNVIMSRAMQVAATKYPG